MTIEIEKTQSLLCERLCARVKVVQRANGFTMLDTPFSFPDGDQYPIYIKETRTGGLRLSDGGHTLMHLSYEHDVQAFRDGARGRLWEQVLNETGLEEKDGEFFIDTSLDNLPDAVFRLGQALTQIHDLTFLSRARVASTFYEDLKASLTTIVDEEKITQNYFYSDMENSEDYPIDYKIAGKADTPLFLFGIPNRDKALLTTITLERLLRYGAEFESLLVFEDQSEMPRRDLARLSNVGGEMVASLDARDDFKRKMLRRVALN